MPSHAFTISKLARAAGVNVETIRYYQRRGLLAEPPGGSGSFRTYDEGHVQRLQFIRRAQELGFSLDDAAQLLSLSAATDRRRVREMTRAHVLDVRQKIARLESMAAALEGLADHCAKSAPNAACPIIGALAGSPLADHSSIGHSGARHSRKTVSK